MAMLMFMIVKSQNHHFHANSIISNRLIADNCNMPVIIRTLVVVATAMKNDAMRSGESDDADGGGDGAQDA